LSRYFSKYDKSMSRYWDEHTNQNDTA